MPGLAVKTPIPPDVLEIVQAVCHFSKVVGDKVVFFLQLLFIKRIEGQTIVGVIHQFPPPVLE